MRLLHGCSREGTQGKPLPNRSSRQTRDKKGFTPLILAATAGHVDVVEILLEHGADIEAQSERTKDTPLSLACSGGRYEVVELLLSRVANKEHRNVSDYTPLSLAASGGFVNIIKLLLSHGAEINSRTGSKLGISPLMLAAMNGHTAAVKLLLDMGSDINAQIETNRNTALTLACFQGRHEVVSLLVDRRANIEHRAKTGLTPLMEAASGGYVEVGRVLLDKGADVNAPPVPSSRDTALTIAADKGHYRFVELLLSRHASVDVKNKKGNSPLWLACHGGHLDVVQLLVTAGADIDSQDNRKVSCLMAAFRKGHIKVVKWMVKHVNQFPSDAELSRYIATITDKDLQKKCQQCMEIIVSAKDRQAAEAYKIASDLLEELDKERQHEENRKAAAAKKREKKKKKKKEKQGNKEKEPSNGNSKNSSPEPESEDSQPQDKEEKEESNNIVLEPPSATMTSTLGLTLPTSEPIYSKAMVRNKRQEKRNNRSEMNKDGTPTQDENEDPRNNKSESSSRAESKKNKRNRKERGKDRQAIEDKMNVPEGEEGTTVRPLGHDRDTSSRSRVTTGPGRGKKGDKESVNCTAIGDLDDFGNLPSISDRDIEKLRKNVEKTKINKVEKTPYEKGHAETTNTNVLSVKSSPGLVNSPKRGQKKEDGWKEVIRKSKKVQVPSNAISKVIGRGGCNINAIREVSGANIDVEKNKGSGERTITIKGSAEATRQAHALITALITDPDKELIEILPKSKSKPPPENKSLYFIPPSESGTTAGSQSSSSAPQKSSNKTLAPRLQQQAAISSGIASRMQNSAQNVPTTSIVWGNSSAPGSSSPRRNTGKVATVAPYSVPTTALNGPATGDKSGVTRQLFTTEKRGGFGSPNNLAKVTMAGMQAGTRTTSSPPTFSVRPDGKSHGNRHNSPKTLVHGQVKLLQRPTSSGGIKHEPQPLPIISNQTTSTITTQTVSSSSNSLNMSSSGEFSPFDNLFSNAADQLLGKKDESSERMNFASVAAAGVVAYPGNSVVSPVPHSPDPLLQAKAPGFKPSPGPRMAAPHEPTMGMKGPSFLMQPQLLDMNIMSTVQGLQSMHAFPVNPHPPTAQLSQSPNISPRSSQSSSAGLSPRSSSSGFDPPSGSQKEEYTTPDQPMTLPKISSSLNPNAPNFFSRSFGNPGISGPGGPPNMPGPGMPVPPMYQQALAQQLLSFVNNINPNPGSNPPGGPPSQSPGPPSQDPLGNINSNQQEFYQNFANLMQQFAIQNQTPGSPGVGPSPGPGFTQSAAPRPFSPLPMQGRPSSAPSIGGVLQRDAASPTAIGPPRTNSPLPPSTPPLSDIIRPNMDDRRQPRPIGGERNMRKTPGLPAGPDPDYGAAFWSLSDQLSVSMDWSTKTSPSLQSSANPTCVISGGTVSTNPSTSSESHNPIASSIDDLSDQNFPHYVQSSGIPPMHLFNGVGNYQSPGFGSTPISGSGDGMQTMWSVPVESTSSEDLQDSGLWSWSK